jgi:hypothetical protein
MVSFPMKLDAYVLHEERSFTTVLQATMNATKKLPLHKMFYINWPIGSLTFFLVPRFSNRFQTGNRPTWHPVIIADIGGITFLATFITSLLISIWREKVCFICIFLTSRLSSSKVPRLHGAALQQSRCSLLASSRLRLHHL